MIDQHQYGSALTADLPMTQEEAAPAVAPATFSGNADDLAILDAHGNPDFETLGRLGARPRIRRAQRDGADGARQHLVQRHGDLPFHIGAAPLRGFSLTPMSCATSEEVLEKVAEARSTKLKFGTRLGAMATSSASAGTRIPSRRRLESATLLPIGSQRVVLASVSRITEDLIGLVDLLELLLRDLFVLGDIRVVFAGQFSERFFQFLGRRGAGNPQNGVVVFEFNGHRFAPVCVARAAGANPRCGSGRAVGLADAAGSRHAGL